MNADAALVAAAPDLAALAVAVADEHRQVGQHYTAAIHHALAAGDLLIAAKARLPHGAWGAWIAEACTLSERTAQLYMRLARNRPAIEQAKAQGLADLGIEQAAVLLAAPRAVDSTPARPESLPAGRYAVILADPPWRYETWTAAGTGRSAEQHYQTQSTEWIASLPVAEMAADDCALFLWATYPMLPDAFRVVEAWGFDFKTVAFTWVKQSPKSGGSFAPKLHTGLGHWTRSNAEPCLLATRGSPRRQAMDVHSVIESPIREHSRKPDEAWDRIERLVAGPYLELFARYPRAGWTAWGDQSGSASGSGEEAAG